ncbi:MAG: DUF1573 domain-containing protein [Proteobacteria bacterium]|nr:DUF1573 domain-containing protein [Pseudomonadota bacterium]
MRKICFVISLLVLCSIFCALPVEAQEIKGPLLVMEERSFDFKEVREGEILEHAFRIRNIGDRILEIKKVQTG